MYSVAETVELLVGIGTQSTVAPLGGASQRQARASGSCAAPQL